MRLHKLNQEGISHYLVPALVVAIVALVGVKVLAGSHADSPTAVTSSTTTTPASNKYADFFNYTNAVAAPGVSVAGSQVQIIGSQDVVYLKSGSQLTFSESNTVAGSTSCYYVNVVPVHGETTETAKVEFTSVSNSITKNLTYNPNNGDNFEQVCVGSSDKAHLDFNVANLSTTGPDVVVYQETMSWSLPN